ncbi:MAG: putative binding-dependent transport protein (periplasmic) [Ramlibacter sp.]|jgi:peptide/nickel transport system substrate-binding protein|nr:putative binding-dependent transport protein (periplasmic) [Ramlibacter sp.]
MHFTRKLLLVLLLGASCALAGAQVLRWSSQGDVQTLDPHSNNELLTNSVNGQVYDPLVRRDRQLGLVPGLAVEWMQLGPRLWRMKLRPGVRFHDGSPFTADDVVFSVLRAQQPTSGFRVYALAVGEPRQVDELTVEFTLPAVNPVFLEHLATLGIMSRKWCEAHGATAPQDFNNKEQKYSARSTNGTGPYMLVSREPDVKTVFRRNPAWWGRFDGNVQEVVFTPLGNDATRLSALVSGQLDLVVDPAPQDLDNLARQRGVRVLEGTENRIIFIGMDQARDELLHGSVKDRNPFKDVRVRRALYHAIDIEAIRKTLMRGRAWPTGSMMHNSRGTYDDPELEKRLPYDPALARQLLAEAGYPGGFDVTLDCPNNRYVNDEEICIALSAMWARVGVRVRVNAMPRTLYFQKVLKLDTSLFLAGWGGPITDAETTLTPVLRPRGAGSVGQFNLGNYRSARLDELAAASTREPDPARRAELVKAAFREHNEQVHHIPLHRQVSAWAMRSNVEAVHRADNWLEWRWVTVR